VITVIVPIVLTVGIGFALECRRSMDVRALSGLSIYVLLPCLILHSLLTTELTLPEALPLVWVVLLTTAALWLLGKSLARIRRDRPEDESAFLLTTMFMNAGNMGMPVALYAFGERGLDLAVIWVLVINSGTNTVGVYYASRHRGGRRQALRTVFSLPAVYAAAAALAMRALDIPLPGFLLSPVRLIGMSLIPLGQLLLGMQLAKARSQVNSHLTSVMVPNALRLVMGPLLAFGCVSLLGIEGLTAKVAIIAAGMPTAVNVAIYATEFDLQPRRIATAVFTSTVASFVTLSVLLAALG
jgi:predicted permease